MFFFFIKSQVLLSFRLLPVSTDMYKSTFKIPIELLCKINRLRLCAHDRISDKKIQVQTPTMQVSYGGLIV